MRAALVLAVTLGLGLGACRTPPPLPSPELPPVPRDPGFVLRQELRFQYGESSGSLEAGQELRFQYGESSGSLEAVVQSRCGVLTIVGLAPFGARVFTLVQRAGALEVKLHLPGSWPFPPENVARDVHRALLVPLPGEAPEGGARELVYGGERVSERWQQGALVERRLVPLDAPAARGVTVAYRDGATAAAPGREIRLENLDRGYVLEISTLEQRPLACTDGG
jgi:hypothetical protein